MHEFYFDAGSRGILHKGSRPYESKLFSEVPRPSLVAVARIPKPYRRKLGELWVEDRPLSLGYIYYKVRGSRATPIAMYPKTDLWVETQGLLPGLGGWFEALALKHLRKVGVKTVVSTRSPEEPRIKQLRRARLRMGVPLGISKWRARILRASYRAKKKYLRSIAKR